MAANHHYMKQMQKMNWNFGIIYKLQVFEKNNVSA